MWGPGQYNTNCNILLLHFFKVVDKMFMCTKENSELLGVEPETSRETARFLALATAPLSHSHTGSYMNPKRS